MFVLDDLFIFAKFAFSNKFSMLGLFPEVPAWRVWCLTLEMMELSTIARSDKCEDYYEYPARICDLLISKEL